MFLEKILLVSPLSSHNFFSFRNIRRLRSRGCGPDTSTKVLESSSRLKNKLEVRRIGEARTRGGACLSQGLEQGEDKVLTAKTVHKYIRSTGVIPTVETAFFKLWTCLLQNTAHNQLLQRLVMLQL